MTDIQKPDMSKQWAASGNKTPPSDSLINTGWSSGDIPTNADFNYIDARQDQGIAYILQKGIPEWDNSTEYQAGKGWVQYSGKLYKATTTSVNKQPSTQPLFWQPVDVQFFQTLTVAGFDSTGIPDNSLIFSYGRSAVGDSGGGLFVFTTSTAAVVDGGIVFAPTGGGRIIRVVSSYVDPLWFDAKADGSDTTTSFQAAVNALPSGGILCGFGRTYTVKKIRLKSNMTLRDTDFITLAGAVPSEYWSPVTIGANGDTSLSENITCINVHVNGNRLNNNTGSVGNAEDGGKHGFRVIGNARGLRFIDCSAMYCGSYGFFFYRGLNTAPIPFQDIATIENVELINCVSKYNKSHGGAVDSIKNLTISGGEYTHNGLDYNTDAGALTLGGNAYSNAWDFEGYGIGSWIGNVKIINADMRFNAAGSLYIQDPVLTTDSRFAIRDGIFVSDVLADCGQHPLRLNPNTAVIITTPFDNWSLGSVYKNVTISGGNIIGEINLACADDVRLNTPQTTTRGILGEAAYCNRVECVTSSDLKFTNLFAATVVHKREVEYEFGAFTPIVSSSSGAISSYTASGSWVRVGKLVTVCVNYTITSNGTGTGAGRISGLPFATNANGASASSRVGGTTGEQCAVSASGTEMFVWKYNNTYPWADGATGTVSLSYIIA